MATALGESIALLSCSGARLEILSEKYPFSKALCKGPRTRSFCRIIKQRSISDSNDGNKGGLFGVARRSSSSRGLSRVSASDNAPISVGNVSSQDAGALYLKLDEAAQQSKAEAVKAAMEALKDAGVAKSWNSYQNVTRRQVFVRELSNMGIKNPENLAVGDIRNDFKFLLSILGGTTLIAVPAGQLPGDWGFFVPYLVGSLSLVVLAIGSTAPGLLQFLIDRFSAGFGDYKDRLLRHEAAHFLVAYLLGIPVVSFSLDLGKEHVNLVDEDVQKRIYQGNLGPGELDKLAAVAMAGLAAEGLVYDKVMGQAADLITLQRLINRSKPKIEANQQQNLTRWGVLFSASLLKNHSGAHSALMAAMDKKLSVPECIKAIEGAM